MNIQYIVQYAIYSISFSMSLIKVKVIAIIIEAGYIFVYCEMVNVYISMHLLLLGIIAIGNK